MRRELAHAETIHLGEHGLVSLPNEIRLKLGLEVGARLGVFRVGSDLVLVVDRSESDDFGDLGATGLPECLGPEADILMGFAAIIANQERILANHEAILANEERIVAK